MKRFGAVPGLLGVILLLAACGSSDNPTKPLTPGDNSDANFQFVSDEVVDGYSFEGVDLGLGLTGALIDSIPGAPLTRGTRGALPAIEDGELVIESYSYTLNGTWHVFQVSGFVAQSTPVDTFDLEAVDSIQLQADGAPVVYPDSTMDGFNYRLQFDVWSRSTSDSLAGYHDVQARLTDDLTAELNADLAENIRFQYSDSAKTCDVSVANSLKAIDVVIDIFSGGCPLSGSVVLTSAISIDCQGSDGGFATSVDGVWTIRGTFDGTTESYTVTDGSTVWTLSQPCGDAVAAAFRW